MSSSPFKLNPEFAESYRSYIELGKTYLKNKNIFVTGLIRNGETYIDNSITSLEQLRQYSKSLGYFVYENDSRDHTPKILDGLTHKIENFSYSSELLSLKGFAAVKDKERTTNLANHRNKCKNFIQNQKLKIDHIIVTDLDFSSLSIDGILNSFGWISKKQTDAMAGFSFEFKPLFNPDHKVPWNYDCWAYRGSWWEDTQKITNTSTYDSMIWFGLWHPPIGSKPILVNSAFGGMTIYKPKHFFSADYEGDDCEHVCFHKNIVNKNPKFKLAINPSQIMIF